MTYNTLTSYINKNNSDIKWNAKKKAYKKFNL